jgi:hypothetical protein
MYKNNSKHEQTENPQYYNGTLQKIRNNKFFKLTPYLLSAVIGFSAAYNFLKTNLFEADAAELQKNLNETKSIECVLSEVDAKDMKEEFWPKWLPKKYRKLICELPANEVRIEGTYLKFIDEPLFQLDYSYQWVKDGNIWKTKLICKGDSGAELTTFVRKFVGNEEDLANIKKTGKIIKSRPLKVHAQETEYKSVPYVLLDSYFRLLGSLPDNFINIKTTNEDKGDIASLEYSLHGGNFNKYVSPLKESASSIEDKIVISNQDEVFKIKIGRIEISSTKYTEQFAEYLVGIEKIGEISEHNRKMSDSERKTALRGLLISYKK